MMQIPEDKPHRLKAKGDRTYSASVMDLPERKFFKVAETECTPPQLPEQSNPKED